MMNATLAGGLVFTLRKLAYGHTDAVRISSPAAWPTHECCAFAGRVTTGPAKLNRRRLFTFRSFADACYLSAHSREIARKKRRNAWAGDHEIDRRLQRC